MTRPADAFRPPAIFLSAVAQIVGHDSEIAAQDLGPADEHVIEARSKRRGRHHLVGERAQTAFRAVARNRIADLAARGKADAQRLGSLKPRAPPAG